MGRVVGVDTDSIPILVVTLPVVMGRVVGVDSIRSVREPVCNVEGPNGLGLTDGEAEEPSMLPAGAARTYPVSMNMKERMITSNFMMILLKTRQRDRVVSCNGFFSR